MQIQAQRKGRRAPDSLRVFVPGRTADQAGGYAPRFSFRGDRHVAVLHDRKPRHRSHVGFFLIADHGDCSDFRDDRRPAFLREQNHSTDYN